MSDLKHKKEILEKANYRYHFMRSIYFNFKDKRVVSLEAIEDRDVDWLANIINKKKETDEWEIYFSTTPPSEKIRNEIIAELSK